MRIEPWFPNDVDYAALIPGLMVWTLELRTSDLPQTILCDQAWDHWEDTSEHFWIRTTPAGEGKLRVLSMTLREYLIAHLKHVHAMNPFWHRGRSEFISRWEAVHGPLYLKGVSR
jgi:hypothetical protein